jgi:hypothetical protein
MSRHLEITNDNWGDSLSLGGIAPAGELLAPPEPARVNKQAIFWALTLAAFLGGTAYGYSFRKVNPGVAPALTIVNDGAALVARWDPASVAKVNAAALTLRADGEPRNIALDSEALRKGEIVLPADPDQPAEISWSTLANSGASKARFLAGDPLEPAIAKADEESLRQQIEDQRALNTQMNRRLAQLRKR